MGGRQAGEGAMNTHTKDQMAYRQQTNIETSQQLPYVHKLTVFISGTAVILKMCCIQYQAIFGITVLYGTLLGT